MIGALPVTRFAYRCIRGGGREWVRGVLVGGLEGGLESGLEGGLESGLEGELEGGLEDV